MLFLLFVFAGSEPCCNLSTADILQLVYNKFATVCSRQVVICLQTPVLVRLVTTTCNNSECDSSTMLQLVNCRLVSACLNKAAETCWRQFVTSLQTTVLLRFITTPCNKPANNLSKTCHHKPEQGVRTHPDIGLLIQVATGQFADLLQLLGLIPCVDLSYFVSVWIFPYLYFTLI